MSPAPEGPRQPAFRRFSLIAGRIHASHRGDEGRQLPVDDETLAKYLRKVLKETAGVQQPPTPRREGATWVFGDVLEQHTSDGPVFFARLGRLRPGFEQDMFDWDHRAFVSAPVEMPAATGYSNFFIDVHSRAILYEERRPAVSDGQFRTYFKRLYEEKSKGGFQLIEISHLFATEGIYEFVRSLDRLTFIVANVEPSNPELDRDFKALDDQLKKARAARAVIKLENEDQGLSTDGTLVSESIALAAAGYGTVALRGARKQEMVSTTSSKNVVREEIERARDSPVELLGILQTRLKTVLRRVIKK